MTSKEAFKEIIKVCNYYHKQISKVDCESIYGYPLKNIEKDLEVLEILKRSIFNKEEHKYAMTEKFKGQKFMLLNLVIREDDINKIKEWLENDD